MGGSSQPTTSSVVTNKNVKYGSTATVNPFASAATNNSGTIAGLKNGTALNTVYNYLNSNMTKLLNDYLYPSLNSDVNSAKLNSFMNTLSANSRKTLENDIINPLTERNIIRSSAANDMINKLVQNNANSVADYSNQLLSESQSNSADVLNNLLDAYMLGYNVISDIQNQSLNTSKGNASETSRKITSLDNSSSFKNLTSLLDSLEPYAKLALKSSGYNL